MTLLERADALAVQIKTYETLKSLAKEVSGFRTRAAQLSGCAAALDRTRRLEGALRASEIDVGPPTAVPNQVRVRAKTILDNFRNDPKSILNPEMSLDSYFVRPIATIASTRWDQLLGTWNTYIGTLLGPLPEHIIKIVERVGDSGFKEDVRAIRRLQERGEQIAATPPNADSADVQKKIAEVREICQQKSEIIGRLRGIPDDVLHFLARSANQQALLPELTPSIKDWLTEKDLLNAFHIVLR